MEFVVDMKNEDGVDVYEFIEVYNMMDRFIYFKDYYICYCYLKEGLELDMIWRLKEDMVILLGGVYVFWLRCVVLELMIDDFNCYYGIQLKEGKYFVVIEGMDGMFNDWLRMVVLLVNIGKIIVLVYY